MNFGSELQKFRQESGCTQQELSQAVCVSNTFISKLENSANRSPPSLSLFFRLMERLGVPRDKHPRLWRAAKVSGDAVKVNLVGMDDQQRMALSEFIKRL